jgi:hypothetical protein
MLLLYMMMYGSLLSDRYVGFQSRVRTVRYSCKTDSQDDERMPDDRELLARVVELEQYKIGFKDGMCARPHVLNCDLILCTHTLGTATWLLKSENSAGTSDPMTGEGMMAIGDNPCDDEVASPSHCETHAAVYHRGIESGWQTLATSLPTSHQVFLPELRSSAEESLHPIPR